MLVNLSQSLNERLTMPKHAAAKAVPIATGRQQRLRLFSTPQFGRFGGPRFLFSSEPHPTTAVFDQLTIEAKTLGR
jgi:hypothetical protein